MLRIVEIGVTNTKPWSTAWVSALGRTRRIIQRQDNAWPAGKKVIKHSGIPSLPFHSYAQDVHHGWMAWCASLGGLKGSWLHRNDKMSHVHRELGCDNLPFPDFLHNLWAQGSRRLQHFAFPFKNTLWEHLLVILAHQTWIEEHKHGRLIFLLK